jgi:hypothetical protein
VLDGWSLPNPVVLGPGLVDHPSAAPRLMHDPRFRAFILTCDWMYREFSAVYGADKCALWHAGIDTDAWPDLAAEPKRVDMLIYDKIRWNRSTREAEVLRRLIGLLEEHGMSYDVIRYGAYDYATYRASLARARSMAFLCEHETQGLAYQEAMASNVPILAWDPGEWQDPQARSLHLPSVATTSVPYFSRTCGVTFKGGDDLPHAFQEFWSAYPSFAPRQYVLDYLSLDSSARRYTEIVSSVHGRAG